VINWNPHAYQLEAVKFMLQNSNAGLFFDPGLGKTSCVYAAFKVLKEKGMVARILVVAPLRVATSVWPAEARKWTDFAGMRVIPLHGPNKAKRMKENADVFTITPEGLAWLVQGNNLAELGVDMLVVDESSYFRHGDTARVKNIRSILHHFRRRYILTGTPAPRGYEDLFQQVYILDEGAALGRYITRYRMQYFYDAGRGYPDWKLRSGADKEINARLKPLVLRGDAVDHLNMPRLIHNEIRIDLPPGCRAMYDKLERDFILSCGADGDVLSPNTAVLGNKLRQVANGFVYTDTSTVRLHEEKLAALERLIGELEGQPALVLYEFEADRDLILNAFPGAVYLNGTVLQVDALIDRFNNGGIPLLVAHPASAGHGLNLQGAANHIIWYGPTWNLEHHDQAIARVWRQGNPHERVFVHTIVADLTKDVDVCLVLQHKDRTQRSLLDALKRPTKLVEQKIAEVSTH
jgi:SNF2 family DNA or RNA helicase